MSTPTPSRITMAPPDSFDGSHSKFRGWLRQVKIYHRGNHITDDEDRILSTLSCMKEGPAAVWAQRFADQHLDQKDLGKWDDFIKALEATFQDHTATKKAREQVEHFTQGRQLVDEFFNHLDTLLSEAEVTAETEKVRLLEKSADKRIIDSIYSSGNLPTKYDDYKDRVLKIGRLWEQRREQAELTRRFIPSHPTPQHRPILPPAPQPPPHADRKTPTGVVYGGKGRPMDVDTIKKTNRCFSCGEVGHFRRDCPQPTKRLNVRAILMEFTEEEKLEMRKELAEEDAPVVNEVTSNLVEDFIDGQ